MENKEVGFDKMRKLTGAIGLLEAIREMIGQQRQDHRPHWNPARYHPRCDAVGEGSHGHLTK